MKKLYLGEQNELTVCIKMSELRSINTTITEFTATFYWIAVCTNNNNNKKSRNLSLCRKKTCNKVFTIFNGWKICSVSRPQFVFSLYRILTLSNHRSSGRVADNAIRDKTCKNSLQVTQQCTFPATWYKLIYTSTQSSRIILSILYNIFLYHVARDWHCLKTQK